MKHKAAVVLLCTIGALSGSARGAERRHTPAIPMLFEPNQGQAAEPARFVAHAPGCTVRFEPDSAVFAFAGAEVRMSFRDAQTASVTGESPSTTVRNYYRGNDPRSWLTNVPAFHRIRYRELLPGIDMVFHSSPDLEFDLALAPGADPNAIEFIYDGIREVEIDSSGDLRLETSTGFLRQHAPDVFQGNRRITARYVRRGDRAIGIELGSYDRGRAVLIDPRITYATYFGGGTNEAALASGR